MSDVKSSISEALSYQEIGEYWDNHDLSEAWEQTQDANFEISGCAKTTYFPIESSLSDKLRAVAHQRGVLAETLVNLWLQEKIEREAA
ncbi:MAG TPA: CopG family antitoxin [Abditibacteriaceae bacterium]|jgi:hypothetical protein|nr:CopG family antitoxin [Abditibacteriaceae bacterium]